MAATTISRATWTDDTGTASAPNLDGTVINNARLQADVYDKIDALYTSAFTFGSTVSAEGFGTHTFSAGGAGANSFRIRNTTAGTGNSAEVSIGNDGSATAGRLIVTSSTFTASGDAPQDGLLIRSERAGGLYISASNASGSIFFYATSTSNFVGSMTFASSGGVLYMNSSGNVAAPCYSFNGDSDTGMYRVGANQIGFAAGGANAVEIRPGFVNSGPYLYVDDRAVGAGAFGGPGLLIGRNTSGAGSAAWLGLTAGSSTVNYFWVDSSAAPGVLRISTAYPEEDGAPADTSGTVVGTQTSSLDTKELLGDGVTPADALQTILHTRVVRFRYKGNAYSGTVFHGIVSDWSPAFGMDPDATHPNGRSFNPISAFGYSVQAFKALEARIAALEQKAA